MNIDFNSFRNPNGDMLQMQKKLQMGAQKGKETALYVNNQMSVRNQVMSDPYYSNVVLLLHLNNTSYTDNSLYNATVTPVDAVTVSTSIFKFGGGSASFDGAVDTLTIPYNVAYEIDPAEDFTIEFSVYHNAAGALFGYIQGEQIGGPAGTDKWFVGYIAGQLRFSAHSGGPTLSVGWSPVLDTWYDIAVCRQGAQTYLFVDGILLAFGTQFSGYGFNSGGFTVGGITTPGYLNGYIDEVRVTNGVARYTANYSVATSEFPNF